VPAFSADDFATIRARLKEIEVAEKPRCPQMAGRFLHDCLRIASRCPSECPHYGDWIGPQT
jgi:hypothetical protein